MSKDNNLTDFLTDVADAIREKKGTTDKINPQDFSDEIKSIKTSTSSSMWTGHVDVEGLKAIGWDDEDIAYYQEHGVNWMEEDDEYHKVSDDNKALYSVLTADNIQEYKDRIVWLPKIDFSKTTNLVAKFQDCVYMKGLPVVDAYSATALSLCFMRCYSLTCIQLINTSKVVNFGSAFRQCFSLMYINPIDTSARTQGIDYAFQGDYNLKEGISVFVGGTGDIRNIYTSCSCMEKCEDIDAAGRDINAMFLYCYVLKYVNIKNLASNLNLSLCMVFSKKSLLYIIENEAATTNITITLAASAYARLAEDPDIVAALNNHPSVSLASA